MSKYAYYSRFVLLAFGAILFSTYSSESAATKAFTSIQPPALVATIIGENRGPKKYIRVEINGPVNKKMSTNIKGMISTVLQPGDYIILIKERGRQMEFKLTVEKNEVTTKTFVLAW